jgi:chemotaxis response regulator CheB
LRIKQAQPDDQLQPGAAFTASSDYHRKIESNKTIALSRWLKVSRNRTAADVLFRSLRRGERVGAGGSMPRRPVDRCAGLRARR